MTKQLNDTLGKRRSAGNSQKRPARPGSSVRASRHTYAEGCKAGEADAEKSATAPKKLKS